MKASIVCVALALTVAACGSDAPTTGPSPTPAPAPTAPTLQSVSFSAFFTGFKAKGATFPVTATGTFSDGTTQNVTADCSSWFSDNLTVLTISNTGVITVVGSGTSTITASCRGVNGRGVVTLTVIPDQVFVRTGTGANVFDLPTYVTRVRIVGDYGGSCENFIIHIAGRGVVNEILGSCSVATSARHFDGTYATSGGQVEVLNSTGIAWSVTEVR